MEKAQKSQEIILKEFTKGSRSQQSKRTSYSTHECSLMFNVTCY